MEYEFMTTECALPCLVVSDEDNGRYMIQNFDRSGEVFNSKEELVKWMETFWSPDLMLEPERYDEVLQEIKESVLPV
ncbi:MULTISPECIES: hypothetical protein [Salimicrobium]|uniref:Threonine dehydratase n=2 Tax=Salimicrobium TaxID=351195 RepID=A0ABY1KWD5_9BACI|nr:MULTISPECIES: hypothetical protein [Salimicrobium]SDY19596.1 hypothetical protein SAMN04488081_2303 [Salimicrobium album]SIS86065.1 hypothetical protein SAMN05421758_107135 [Salimicrobium salexigens]